MKPSLQCTKGSSRSGRISRHVDLGAKSRGSGMEVLCLFIRGIPGSISCFNLGLTEFLSEAFSVQHVVLRNCHRVIQGLHNIIVSCMISLHNVKLEAPDFRMLDVWRFSNF